MATTSLQRLCGAYVRDKLGISVRSDAFKRTRDNYYNLLLTQGIETRGTLFSRMKERAPQGLGDFFAWARTYKSAQNPEGYIAPASVRTLPEDLRTALLSYLKDSGLANSTKNTYSHTISRTSRDYKITTAQAFADLDFPTSAYRVGILRAFQEYIRNSYGTDEPVAEPVITVNAGPTSEQEGGQVVAGQPIRLTGEWLLEDVVRDHEGMTQFCLDNGITVLRPSAWRKHVLNNDEGRRKELETTLRALMTNMDTASLELLSMSLQMDTGA